MTKLSDQTVIQIAKEIATANSVSFSAVSTAPVLDSSGETAIEIKFELTPGSSAGILGEPSARTVSQLIQKLADQGDNRFPIVRYEEKAGAAGPK